MGTQSQRAVKVQKDPQGQLVVGQQEKGTPMGTKVLSEVERKRETEVQSETQQDRNMQTEGDRGERQTERQMLQDRKSRQWPLWSQCQQSCNCHLMLDSPGGKMMAGGGRGGKGCGSDKMVKDRGRTWGVACLAGSGCERTQGYHCTEEFTHTHTEKDTRLSCIYSSGIN